MTDDWSDDDTPAAEPVQESRGRGRGGRGGGGGGGRTCFGCGEEGHTGRDCPKGGGGGGGGRACFKCGEEGHMSRECPSGGGGGGGGGGNRACYKCGEEGHMSRECPSGDGGGGGGGGNRACFKCGEEGHMSRECPSGGGGGGGGGNRACYKCGEEGHMSRECPSGDGGGGGGGGGGNRACYKCGEEGHMSRECPSAGDGGGGGGGGGNRTCHKCGEEGHMSRECPSGGGGGGGGSRGCFNCGEEGHMSRDCPNPKKEDGGRPPREGAEGEPPKERYNPPEMLEGDAIFEDRKQTFEGSGINFSKYEAIAFNITGDNVVKSVNSFEELGLRPLVLDNLKKCGYDRPTPIQKHGSPQLINGLHVMCCAQTGSGKTAAFLLPIINRLLQQQDTLTPAMTAPATPEALILAPTRELAIQIGKEANMYANGSMVKTQVAYGGTAIFSQKQRLMKGCNILVATTGRLKQFISEKIVDVSKVRYFILDEADRMLDMGFMPDVNTVVESLPPKEERVSGMFSATFPPDIQAAAKNILGDYVYIVIGVVGGACADVKQEIVQVERAEKRKKIMDILAETPKTDKVLVFCSSKKGADFLATYLSSNNHSCTSIHGDRLQSQRELALMEFTTGRRQVLVATAVAARGLGTLN
ncbi:unnamed protein product [Orchesella dallaii]|uniref:RNA helicase n=1 Tax=Orchesella dallaii TaxID=48710 RepID=A0ABP1PYN0_9HEXA